MTAHAELTLVVDGPEQSLAVFEGLVRAADRGDDIFLSPGRPQQTVEGAHLTRSIGGTTAPGGVVGAVTTSVGSGGGSPDLTEQHDQEVPVPV